MKKKQLILTGFTLIELVIVIVILAILAATSAPKFLNLKKDSKAVVLEGIAAAMQGGLQLVHSQATIDNQLAPQTAVPQPMVTISGIDIPLHYGYPAVNGGDSFLQLNNQIKAWIDIDMVDRNTMNADPNREVAQFFSDKWSKKNIFYIFFGEDYYRKSGNLNCRVQYTNDPDSISDPKVEVYSDAC